MYRKPKYGQNDTVWVEWQAEQPLEGLTNRGCHRINCCSGRRLFEGTCRPGTTRGTRTRKPVPLGLAGYRRSAESPSGGAYSADS